MLTCVYSNRSHSIPLPLMMLITPSLISILFSSTSHDSSSLRQFSTSFGLFVLDPVPSFCRHGHNSASHGDQPCPESPGQSGRRRSHHRGRDANHSSSRGHPTADHASGPGSRSGGTQPISSSATLWREEHCDQPAQSPSGSSGGTAVGAVADPAESATRTGDPHRTHRTLPDED